MMASLRKLEDVNIDQKSASRPAAKRAKITSSRLPSLPSKIVLEILIQLAVVGPHHAKAALMVS